MFRRCLVRLYEDSCRRVGVLRDSRHWDLVEKKSLTGLRSNLKSIVKGAARIRLEGS
jgi:hypothetical protein